MENKKNNRDVRCQYCDEVKIVRKKTQKRFKCCGHIQVIGTMTLIDGGNEIINTPEEKKVILPPSSSSGESNSAVKNGSLEAASDTLDKKEDTSNSIIGKNEAPQESKNFELEEEPEEETWECVCGKVYTTKTEAEECCT